MGLFDKISGKKSNNQIYSPQKKLQQRAIEREPNVLHNPSAYLAYGGDGVDRGAMMAQQAATRTHQMAVNAAFGGQRKDERLPPPTHPHPLPALQNLGRVSVQNLSEKEQAFVDKINFSSHKKVTELYLHQLVSPEWVNAFEPFGFDSDYMNHLKASWHDAIRQQLAFCVKAYKKESNIPKSALLNARDCAARATGRAVTRNGMYNGVTIAIRGRFDKELKEPYFELTVPTSAREFSSWRKTLMAQYNPLREGRGVDPIRFEGDNDIVEPLLTEIQINGLP